MAKLWRIVESIVFAGLQPGRSRPEKAPKQGPGWLSRLLVGSSKPVDPLYLSNRTAGQRLRVAAVIAIPVLIVCGLAAYAFIHRKPVNFKPVGADLTAEELSRDVKLKVDNALRDLRIESNTDVQVVEAMVLSGKPQRVKGSARNTTERTLRGVKLDFALATGDGRRLAMTSTTLATMPPKSTLTFEFSIDEREAETVEVVRISGY
jgi:hypothetical protein